MGSTETSNPTFWTKCAGNTPRDRRNLRRVAAFYVGWAVLFMVGSQLIKRGIVAEGAAAWAVAVLPSLCAVLVIAAAARLLREADELQRLIHMEAMTLSFGATYFAALGWRLLERVGAPTAAIDDAIIPLSVFYAVGLVIGARRYR